MNLSQQSSHIVLGPSATMPTPAVPASAVATAVVAAANDIGGGGGDDNIKTPLLTEKEVQVVRLFKALLRLVRRKELQSAGPEEKKRARGNDTDSKATFLVAAKPTTLIETNSSFSFFPRK